MTVVYAQMIMAIRWLAKRTPGLRRVIAERNQFREDRMELRTALAEREQINRRLTTHVTDVHFPPTEASGESAESGANFLGAAPECSACERSVAIRHPASDPSGSAIAATDSPLSSIASNCGRR